MASTVYEREISCSVICENCLFSNVGYLAKNEQSWALAAGLLQIADDRSIAIYIHDVFQV